MDMLNMLKMKMLKENVNYNDEESVREYLVRTVGKQYFGNKREELIESIMGHLGFGIDESKFKFNEIFKWKDMLDKANIPYEFNKHQFGNGYHLEYKVDGYQIYSVIQTDFSYGSKEGKV